MITLNALAMGYWGHAIGAPVNGHFATGSLTAIAGANGCGKSTLLKTLAGLLPAVAGEVRFAQGNRPRIAYLPQQSDIDRQFPVNVFDVIAMGCWPRTGLLRGIRHKDRLRIAQAMERVGLSQLARRPIEALSGGQFQRMLFARLLVQDAPLILLDEPFTGIDASTCTLLMEVIAQLHADGRTLLVVLHDNALVVRHFPSTLLFTPTGVRWGPTCALFAPAGAQPGSKAGVVPFNRNCL